MSTLSPATIVQRQLDAYNARDLEAWLATYHPDAEQFTVHGPLLARGREAIGSRMRVRFAEPDLQATLLSRIVLGQVVVDHERVTRNFPEGKGSIEVLCVYEVAGDVIMKASFAFGPPVLTEPPCRDDFSRGRSRGPSAETPCS